MKIYEQVSSREESTRQQWLNMSELNIFIKKMMIKDDEQIEWTFLSKHVS